MTDTVPESGPGNMDDVMETETAVNGVDPTAEAGESDTPTGTDEPTTGAVDESTETDEPTDAETTDAETTGAETTGASPTDSTDAGAADAGTTEAVAADTAEADTEAAGDSDVDVAEDLGDEEQDAAPREPSPWLRPGQWFVVHTQSGYEKKVKSNLEARIQSMNVEEKIFEVVIPMEDVVEFKGGRKQVVQRKVFPGYLLVRCEMDDSSWYVIRNTPGVTGFVGQGRFGQKPTPLSRREVDTFLSAKGDGVETPRRSKPKLEYDVGESVRVKEGPFADFTGSVAEINFDHLKLKVLVNIFGRETLVEMDFSQVAKI
jgi:transcriptional antiterminator NusG